MCQVVQNLLCSRHTLQFDLPVCVYFYVFLTLNVLQLATSLSVLVVQCLDVHNNCSFAAKIHQTTKTLQILKRAVSKIQL
jgi:hypothetical protein